MANGDPLPLPRSTDAVLGASAIPAPLLPDIPGLIPQAPVPDLPLPMFGALDAPPDLAGLLPVPQAPLAGAAPTFSDLPAFPESPDLTPPPIVPPVVDAVGVAPAPVTPAGLPGLAPDLPAEFAPDIVGAPAVDASLAAVAELSDEQQAFRLRARDIQLELGAEADPVKRAALQAELADNVRAQQLAGSELGAARGIADEEVAVQSQGVEDQLRAGQRDAVLDVRTQAQEQATLDAAADERLRERQEVARVDQRAAKEQYTRIVRSGPQQPIAATIAASLTEALRAFSEDRPVNFDKALSAMVAQSKESWQRQVDAASQDVQLTGDDITDLARQQSENKIQRAARDAAYAEEVILGLDKEVAAAQDAQSQERAIVARDEWRRKRDALNAEAEAERAKRARADASRDLGDELTRAKVAKEQASAAKTQAEADKLARRGRGGGASAKAAALTVLPPELRELAASGPEGKKAAYFQFHRLVIDPVTGEPQRRKDGTFAIATTPAGAKALNKGGASLASVNRLVNEAIAIRGANGWEPTGEWAGSDAGRRMSALSAQILLVNKNVFDLGVLSDGDIKILAAVQGGKLSGLKDPRPQLKDMQRRMVAAFNDDRASLALGSLPLTFPTVQAAPKQTTRNIVTLLTQAPSAGGDIPSARRRVPAIDELFETLVEENDGNIERAAADFEKRGDTIRKQGEAHLSTLRKQFEASRPSNWDDLRGEQGAAFAARASLGADATGAEINEADLRFSRATRATENAMSKSAKRQRQSIEEQDEFLEALRKRLGGESKRRAEFNQMKRSEVAGAKGRVEDFAAGRVQTGAKGVF